MQGQQKCTLACAAVQIGGASDLFTDPESTNKCYREERFAGVVALCRESFGKRAAIDHKIAGIEQRVLQDRIRLRIGKETADLGRALADLHQVAKLFRKRCEFTTGRLSILFSNASPRRYRLDVYAGAFKLVLRKSRISRLDKTFNNVSERIFADKVKTVFRMVHIYRPNAGIVKNSRIVAASNLRWRARCGTICFVNFIHIFKPRGR